jgi:excisionase family DNA binding protein
MTKPITWSPTAKEALERLRGRLFASTTEAAALLGYDARTVRKAIEAGEIPAVRAGSTYRVPTEWLRKQAALGTASRANDAA